MKPVTTDKWGFEWADTTATEDVIQRAVRAAAPAVRQWCLENQSALARCPAEDVLNLTIRAAVAYLAGQGLIRLAADDIFTRPLPTRLDGAHDQMMRRALDTILAQRERAHAARFHRPGR